MVLLCFNKITSLLITMTVLIGFCENICLPVAELHSTYDIVVEVNETITEVFDWRRPDNTEVAACSVNDRCIPTRPSYVGNMDKRTSILTINSVQKIDTGLWQLHAESSRYNVCRLVTARNPNCTINSDRNPGGIDLGEELTLIATLNGYYCSRLAAFSLTTGNVTEMLQNNHTQDNTTDEDLYTVFSHTVNISLTRFGDVTLNFMCDRRTWSQTCNGVKKIIKSMPLCKISSNRDTDDLDLGDDLTLTVDIRGYYCPKPVGFTLITGKVKDMLLKNHNVRDVTDATFNKTISMRATRFGDVEVHYSCDGDTRKLGCGGVMELVQNGTSPRPVSPFPDPGLPITIIVGASVAALFIIILIIVIIANRRKLQRKAQKYIVARKKTHNALNMEDEIPTGKVK